MLRDFPVFFPFLFASGNHVILLEDLDIFARNTAKDAPASLDPPSSIMSVCGVSRCGLGASASPEAPIAGSHNNM